MEPISLVSGIVLGAIIGGAGAWFAAQSQTKSRSKHLAQTEAELKELFSQQANQHLSTTKEAVASIQTQLEAIKSQITHYESNLSAKQEENSSDTFYGEHASVFLRNTQQPRAQQRIPDSTEAQPKDFSNQSTGLFAGTVGELPKESSKESN